MEWFTAQQIADLRGLTVETVRNLASTHQWRRTGERPQRYHIQDVIASLKGANK